MTVLGRKKDQRYYRASSSGFLNQPSASLFRKKFVYWSAATLALLFAPALAWVYGGVHQGTSNNASGSFSSATPAQKATGNSDAAASPASPQPSSNTTDTSVNASVNSSSDNSSTTDLTVNGQSIPVPDNGSVSKTVQTNDGQTNVDINVQNHGTASNRSSSSTNVHIFSNTRRSDISH
jgi:hypothetical protein